MAAESTSDAVASESGAGAAANLASSHQRDQNSVSGRVTDWDKDTGADERIEASGATYTELNWLNAKRTADLAQTLDTDGIHQARIQQSRMNSMDNRAAEATLSERQRLFHQEMLERETARRHYEDNHTIRVIALGGFTNDAVVEALANNEDFAASVAKKVAGQMS